VRTAKNRTGYRYCGDKPAILSRAITPIRTINGAIKDIVTDATVPVFWLVSSGLKL
jgi:hypothetical protein